MLRRIAPSGEEIMDVHARFGIAQDSKPTPEALSIQDGEPAPEALSIQAGIREKVASLAEHLVTEVEPSRELSLALTHLEKALMWAGKAVFREGGVQVSDIKVGDRVRRVKPCSLPNCAFPSHRVGWEGTVTEVTTHTVISGMSLLSRSSVKKVEDPTTEDAAWVEAR